MRFSRSSPHVVHKSPRPRVEIRSVHNRRVDPIALRDQLLAEALNRGFSSAGIASVRPFRRIRARALRAIEEGRMAGMTWYSPERVEASTDLVRRHPWARSVLALAWPYPPSTRLPAAPPPRCRGVPGAASPPMPAWPAPGAAPSTTTTTSPPPATAWSTGCTSAPASCAPIASSTTAGPSTAPSPSAPGSASPARTPASSPARRGPTSSSPRCCSRCHCRRRRGRAAAAATAGPACRRAPPGPSPRPG